MQYLFSPVQHYSRLTVLSRKKKRSTNTVFYLLYSAAVQSKWTPEGTICCVSSLTTPWPFPGGRGLQPRVRPGRLQCGRGPKALGEGFYVAVPVHWLGRRAISTGWSFCWGSPHLIPGEKSLGDPLFSGFGIVVAQESLQKYRCICQ